MFQVGTDVALTSTQFVGHGTPCRRCNERVVLGIVKHANTASAGSVTMTAVAGPLQWCSNNLWGHATQQSKLFHRRLCLRDAFDVCLCDYVSICVVGLGFDMLCKLGLVSWMGGCHDVGTNVWWNWALAGKWQSAYLHLVCCDCRVRPRQPCHDAPIIWGDALPDNAACPTSDCVGSPDLAFPSAATNQYDLSGLAWTRHSRLVWLAGWAVSNCADTVWVSKAQM